MCVDSIISNVEFLCTQAIHCDIASKMGSNERELTLLDSKFLPVTDGEDKGEYILL